MKKSSSFSFSQVASAASTTKNLNFSQIAAAAAGSKGKKTSLTKSTSQQYYKGEPMSSSVDKSYKQWEQFREKKLESMKSQSKQSADQKRQKSEDASLIKYNHQESIQPPQIKPRTASQQHKLTRHQRDREALREHARYNHRRKISLDPNWYTDNIYSNQSYDDSDCDSVKRPLTTSASFSHYNARGNRYNSFKNNFHHHDFNGNNRSNSININISNTANTKMHGHSSSFEDEPYDINSPYFERHRNYPKSHSCSFAERYRREPDVEVVPDARSRSVPKSHSFSTNRNVMRQYDMDLIEYQRCVRHFDMFSLLTGCLTVTCRF